MSRADLMAECNTIEFNLCALRGCLEAMAEGCPKPSERRFALLSLHGFVTALSTDFTRVRRDLLVTPLPA